MKSAEIEILIILCSWNLHLSVGPLYMQRWPMATWGRWHEHCLGNIGCKNGRVLLWHDIVICHCNQLNDSCQGPMTTFKHDTCHDLAITSIQWCTTLAFNISPKAIASLHQQKLKCRHFDEIFIIGSNERCSQWWRFHQNDRHFHFSDYVVLSFQHLLK